MYKCDRRCPFHMQCVGELYTVSGQLNVYRSGIFDICHRKHKKPSNLTLLIILTVRASYSSQIVILIRAAQQSNSRQRCFMNFCFPIFLSCRSRSSDRRPIETRQRILFGALEGIFTCYYWSIMFTGTCFYSY